MESLLLGVLLTVLGCLLTSLGSLQEKIELEQRPLGNWEERSRYKYIPVQTDIQLAKPYSALAVGGLLWVVGNTLHILALWFSPASVLGPVNALGLIFTLLLARIILGHALQTPTAVFCATSVLGIALCLVSTGSAESSQAQRASAPRSISSLNYSDLALRSWYDSRYIYFSTLTLAVLICLLVLFVTMEKKREAEILAHFDQQSNYPRTEACMRYKSSSWLENEADEGSSAESMTSTVRSIVLAILAGISGSQTVCEIKEMQAYLESYRREGWTALYQPTFPIALCLLLVGCVCQFPLLSQAMEGANVAVTPAATYHASWCLFSVVGSAIKFQELTHFSRAQLALFATGLLVTVLSTCLLSVSASPSLKIHELLIGPFTNW